MDSWKALLRPMCKFCVSKMEMLLESYQGVGMKGMEGEGFTMGRDPTGGVFEEKLFLLKETSFSNVLSFSTRIWRYIFFKRKMLLKNKGIPLEPPT